MADPQEVYDALDAQGIRYETYQHPPVFTGEEAAEHWAPIPATRVKNLFLRNKKGDRHYLVILEIGKQADLRQLVKVWGRPAQFRIGRSPDGAARRDAGVRVAVRPAARRVREPCG